jgi:orotate phosphoribosyltransferase
MRFPNPPPEGEGNLPGLLAARKGHFKLESGHHGDLWLDLHRLFLRPGRIRPFVAELARRLKPHGIEAVCGPMFGGAFVAQLIASELDVDFYYTERLQPGTAALYPVDYRLPSTLRAGIRGMNLAVVDDVVNAGSAVRATLADLQACGARPAALGALLLLGSSASDMAAVAGIPLESIATISSGLWTPAECPLCVCGVPLEDAGA